MRKEQVVGLALRLFAIFLFIQALRQAAGLIPFLTDSTPVRIGIGVVLVSTLVPVAIAAFLWLLPLTIATKLIPGVSAKEPRSTLTATEIASVAFPILGLWVLTSAIPDTFHWTMFIYIVKSSDVGRPELSPENIGNIVATVVELLIGFWLLLGSKGMFGLLKRLRYAGS